MQTFDHMDCGIYAQVIEAGGIKPGDGIAVGA
jgi:MOSC domain-containing protein YiiM